ncbi:MAG: hypothetical protein WD847_18740 [Pirellulales bacterium]
MSHRFNFRLPSLFALTTAVAVLAFALSTHPTWFSGLLILLLAIALSSLLLIGCVHCRDYARAVCLGGIVPLLACVVMLVSVFSRRDGRIREFSVYTVEPSDFDYTRVVLEEINAYRLPVLFFWGVALLIGVLSAAFQWCLKRSGESDG